MSLSAKIICGLLVVITLLGLLQIWNLEQMDKRQKADLLAAVKPLIDSVNSGWDTGI